MRSGDRRSATSRWPDPVARRDEARSRLRAFLHHDCRQHGSRQVPSAGGLNLNVASGITKMGITELAIAVRQWLLTMLVFLVVVTYWPALSIWVPKTFGMM